MHLATAGDFIHIWDVGTSSPSLSCSFNPHNEPVGQVAWTAGNQSIVSSARSGNSVYIKSFADEKERRLTTFQHENCLAFNSNTNYLVTGSSTGHLSIYSVKKLRLKRSYRQVNSAVTSVLFTVSDTSIAGGYTTGEIVVHSVTSGHSQSTFALDNNSGVAGLAASLFNKSLLASGHASGTVALWDVTNNQPVTTFGSHSKQVSQVVFSSFNEMLMLSCGLDERVVIYDVTSRNSVEEIKCPGPVTALDIASDGKAIALGTTTGDVLIYDLRNLRQPLWTEHHAHSSSVNCVRFELTYCASSGASDSQSSIMTNLSGLVPSSKCSRRSSLLTVNERIRSPLHEISENNMTPRDSSLNPSMADSCLSLPLSTGKPNLLASLSFCSVPDDASLSLNFSGRSSISLKEISDLHGDSIEPVKVLPSPSSVAVLSKPSVKVTFLDSPKEESVPCPIREVVTGMQLSQTSLPPETMQHTLVNLESFKKDLRAEIRFDLQHFECEVMSKVIKELVITETNILNSVRDIVDDRQKLLQENEMLRKEIALMKMTF